MRSSIIAGRRLAALYTSARALLFGRCIRGVFPVGIMNNEDGLAFGYLCVIIFRKISFCLSRFIGR